MGKSTKYAIDYSSRIAAVTPQSDVQSVQRLAKEFGVPERELSSGMRDSGAAVKPDRRNGGKP